MLHKEEDIGGKAVEFFSNSFQGEEGSNDFSLVNIIPKFITTAENEEMERLPEEDEVKGAVFLA